MRKAMLLIWIGTLFLIPYSQGNAPKVPLTAMQGTAKSYSTPQKKAIAKTQEEYDGTTNWDSIHAIYAAKKYHTEDSWELVWYNNYLEKPDCSPIDELNDMKIKLLGDSILYLNGKKLMVCRTVREPSMYQRDALYYPFLTKYFANLGINIAKSVPVLLLQSSMEDVYSDMLEYIYTGNYLVLYNKGYVGIYRYIKRKDQGLPSPTAKVEYTGVDLFKDAEKEMSSKHARQYNIREYKGKLKMLFGDRTEEMESNGGFYFVKLPACKGFPIFICYNYHEADIFSIYTYRNNVIDNNNCVEIYATDSYSDETEDFAIFTDGTIYVKTNNGKKSKITVYRINNEGDFYKLN